MIVHNLVRGKNYAVITIVAAIFYFFTGQSFATPAWESSSAVLDAAQSVLPQTSHAQYKAFPPSTEGWLRVCPQRLSVKITSLTEWSATVQVVCNPPVNMHTGYWSVYVPFHIDYLKKIIVARHFLTPGAVIERKDIRMKSVQVNAQTGSVCTHLSKIIGRTLRSGVPEGYPLRPENLLSPLLIRQGERVILDAHYGNVMVSAMGTALNDGRSGETLLVRNNTSQKVLTGIVEPNGSVSLNAGDTP